MTWGNKMRYQLECFSDKNELLHVTYHETKEATEKFKEQLKITHPSLKTEISENLLIDSMKNWK